MGRMILFMLAVYLMGSLGLAWAADPDLLVLYDFKEGSGNKVKDVSGVGNPLDLTIADPANVSWLPGGGLSIIKVTLIASDGPATKIIEGCMAKNEITIEAWVKPANNTQGGPARIVTLSKDSSFRNFTLGQDVAGYQARLRTPTAGTNGSTILVAAPDTVVTNGITKLFYTYDAAEGTGRLYINDKEAASLKIGGDFASWDTSFRFGLVHEISRQEDLGRFWLGEIYQVAIYSRALTQNEIIRTTLLVEPQGKLAATWAKIRALR